LEKSIWEGKRGYDVFWVMDILGGLIFGIICISEIEFYHAVCPPSIFKSDLHGKSNGPKDRGKKYPVIKLLPLPARNTVAARYSSGTESLPRGLCLLHSAFLSGFLSNNCVTINVSIYPGEIVYHQPLPDKTETTAT